MKCHGVDTVKDEEEFVFALVKSVWGLDERDANRYPDRMGKKMWKVEGSGKETTGFRKGRGELSRNCKEVL